MSVQPSRIILTYDDYAALADDGKRYELFEGELEEMAPAPSTPHQDAALALASLLRSHVRAHHLGKVMIAPVDVRHSDITVLQPDVLFVTGARQSIVEFGFIRGAPDLVVEILSPSTAVRDQEIKRQIYARYGVPNYWLIDPLARTAWAYSLVNGVYRLVASASGDAPFSAPPFPELVIPLPELSGNV